MGVSHQSCHHVIVTTLVNDSGQSIALFYLSQAMNVAA
jgi:hypothetical protein